MLFKKEMPVKKVFLFVLAFIWIFFIICSIYAQVPIQSAPQIKVLFSPQDNCAQEIITEVDRAKDYVYVAMYYFTSRPIAQALIRARDRNVNVKVCLDKEQLTYEYSKSRFLDNKGINVKLIGGSGIMHNKFCIIDDHITLTGSCNWTVSADLKNDENLLVIESEEIAGIYKEQFNRFWNGTHIDTCEYIDESRLEKIAVAKGVVLPMPKPSSKGKYVGSKKSNKFHHSYCKWAQKINPKNQIWFKSRQEAIDEGYVPCKVCKP